MVEYLLVKKEEGGELERRVDLNALKVLVFKKPEQKDERQTEKYACQSYSVCHCATF